MGRIAYLFGAILLIFISLSCGKSRQNSEAPKPYESTKQEKDLV